MVVNHLRPQNRNRRREQPLWNSCRPSLTMAALVLTLLVFLLTGVATAEPTQERAALLEFIARVPHASRVQWNTSSSACDWIGVTCDPARTVVETLRLPGAGLVGPIPPGTLGRLSGLRVLSLRSNRLTGPIPNELGNLTLLHSLYLQDNRLSGGIPAGITQLGDLTRLDLSRNNLTGEIPFALNNLTRITGLFLESNQFSGSLPSLNIAGLANFNVSYNLLNGSIPETLQRFPNSSFVDNLDLCGGPLPPCTPFFPSPAPSPELPSEEGEKKKKKKTNLSTGAIIAIAVGSGGGLLILLLLLVICWLCRRRKRGRDGKATAAAPKGSGAVPMSGELGMTSSSLSKEAAAGGGGAGGDRNRLVFLGRGGGYSFDLEDLLRASAEVLGKGSAGTAYKAVLEEGTTVVVKRLKDVAASRREFEQHMDALGRPEVQDHPNIIPIRAYYFSKDEKLLVFDYHPAGSLSSLLHGNRGLEWEKRMQIALAAGRGLAHLHIAAKVVHGNIKASNVLLRPDSESAALSDYALAPLFGPAAAAQAPTSRVAGYRAPEFVETRKPTFKSDVYSLGVLLLELLTGKAPNQPSIAGEEGLDLPRWVQSVVREEWTAEVFDAELMGHGNIEEGMVQLLQIAMACVAIVPDSRPNAHDVVRMMEEIVRRTEPHDDVQPGSSNEPSKGGTPPAATTP